jgi:hypothetical protein
MDDKGLIWTEKVSERNGRGLICLNGLRKTKLYLTLVVVDVNTETRTEHLPNTSRER